MTSPADAALSSMASKHAIKQSKRASKQAIQASKQALVGEPDGQAAFESSQVKSSQAFKT